MTREARRVAVVVFCEAAGVDDYDAAVGAQLALSRLIHEHGVADPDCKLVGVAGPPRCAACGAPATITARGKVRAHPSCESYVTRPGQTSCSGSGKPPAQPSEPVIGFERADRVGIYARVHQIMDVGMAAGNGYLWTRPTVKAFR